MAGEKDKWIFYKVQKTKLIGKKSGLQMYLNQYCTAYLKVKT